MHITIDSLLIYYQQCSNFSYNRYQYNISEPFFIFFKENCFKLLYMRNWGSSSKGREVWWVQSQMGGVFVQTALEKVTSKAGLKPSDLYQNSYKHLDWRSHLNLLSLKYICTNLNANLTFKLRFGWGFVQSPLFKFR